MPRYAGSMPRPESELNVRAERRALIDLALPLVGGQLAAMSMNVVDTLIAGAHSAHTLAVVGLGSAMWSIVIILGVGLMLAVTPTVSQLVGAGRRDEIARTMTQAFWMGLGLGLALMVGLWFGEPLLRLLKVDAALIPDTLKFLRAAAIGAPALVLTFCFRFFSEALGLTRPTLVLSLCGLAVLSVLGWALVFGRLGLPELGPQGSGIALAVTTWLQCLGLAAYIAWSPRYKGLRPFAYFAWPEWSAIAPLLKLGAPMAMMLLMEGGLFVASALLIGSMGPTAVAAHQIAINVASVTFMVPLGLGLATTVFVGQAAGANDVPRVRLRAKIGIQFALMTQILSAGSLMLFPGAIAALYTNNTEIAVLAAKLLALAGIFQFSDGIQVLTASCLRALKDVQVPALITFVAYWPIGMGAGWYCAFSLTRGAPGLWYGLCAGLSAAALLLLWRLVIVLRQPHRWHGDDSNPVSSFH
ncbi:MATE family efflux transporter [Ahniella affigens]|nr:MATE family efflux transporter [Ahniella affigens]